MENKIKLNRFKKSYLIEILDQIVEPTLEFLDQNSDIFQSFENQLKAHELKRKHMYLAYRFFATEGDIMEDLINDLHNTLYSFGVDKSLHENCAKNAIDMYTKFLYAHTTLDDEDKELWQKKLNELQNMCICRYKLLYSDTGEFIEECYDHSIKDLDLHHYDDAAKISASEFMNEGTFDEDEIAEIENLIEDLQEYIDLNYKEGLNEELINSFKEMISKVIAFYELSGEFRTLVYPMNNLYDLLESLNLDTLDAMMKDVAFNFLSNTVKDLHKWVEEVLITQTANDIHYLDASLLASISQMEMMITGDEDEDEDDDDFLF